MQTGDQQLIGHVLEGRYRLDAPIARGGMSTVFRGLDTRLDRPVAIKVMDPKFAGDPQFLSRFEFEARAVAKLKHPALVAVYDQGIDGDYPFLTMELVAGGTLRELLRERGPMPPHAVRAVAEPILDAIGVAHAAGLVHRDIKPENVLISDAGEVKIADFGLVRAVAAANTTSASVILGTAAYLSPEQVDAGTADARSDVYSFGIMIYELLTGDIPFHGDTPVSVAYQRVNNDVPPPSSAISGVPPEFDDLVLRATRRDPAERFPNAAAMATELREIARRLDLPDYRVPAPEDSAAHHSVQYPAPPMDPPTVAHPGSPPPRPAGPQPTRVQTMPRYQPVLAGPRPQPGYSPDPYQAKRNARLWVALVVVLTLLVGATGWWLGIGRFGTVPATAGMDPGRAASTLSSAGFSSTVRKKASDTVPVGNVVGSDPAAGARVTKSTTVAVLVSSGKPRVPEISPGTAVDQADQLLQDQGLIPIDAGKTASSAPEGTFAKADPPAGTLLPTGAHVNVYRSSGAHPVRLPDLRNKTVDQARATLTQLGLTVAGTQEQYDEQIGNGHVVGTQPAAGTTVDGGSSVTLLVSQAITMPMVIGQPVGKARQTLQALGLQVQVQQFAPSDSSVVIGQQPGLGQNVESGSSVTLTAVP